MASNGDTKRVWTIDGTTVKGLGSFHKTLPHPNPYGEVDVDAFDCLVAATEGDGSGFAGVPKGPQRDSKHPTFQLINPQAGLAADELTHHPASYSMPPAPKVDSITTAAEMTELYWMALLRDCGFNELGKEASDAVTDINKNFTAAVDDEEGNDAGHLKRGIDVPGSTRSFTSFTADTVFRLGLPGEMQGPMLSQFFVRDIAYGTQSISQKQNPYASGKDYLTKFADWLGAQNSGNDAAGHAYNRANEDSDARFEKDKNGNLATRYICTMRDLARFVNKDALHQAYFNAALILLSGQAKWTPGNPYDVRLADREAGFGVLGGPHILALVSEIATRALKVVWNQKWQVNLRLRPEAYGGLVQVQECGVDGKTRSYGIPPSLVETEAAKRILKNNGSYLLPMAYTPGSPTHPAYGAGHATVAGACVTVLKAYFKTFTTDKEGNVHPVFFNTLKEREDPFGDGGMIATYETGRKKDGTFYRIPLDAKIAESLTIEGELNKLAQNVAMGRSMGGVHWRTDNTRSLILGEALAAEILADITTDANEKPSFEFRAFARDKDGEPRRVKIANGRIWVNEVLVDTHGSAL